MKYKAKCKCGYESLEYDDLRTSGLYGGFYCPCCGNFLDILNLSKDIKEENNKEYFIKDNKQLIDNIY